MEAPLQHAYEERVRKFWHVVKKGNVLEVEKMITRLGVDVNLRCRNRRGEKGGTVLHVAARHGQLDVVRFILQLRQVEVDALDDRGKTALYRACVGKHTGIALLLAEAGADVSFSTTRGASALKEAQALRKSYGHDLKEVSLKRYISAPAGMRDRLNSRNSETASKEEKGTFSSLSARLRSLFPGGSKDSKKELRGRSPSPSPMSPLRTSPRSSSSPRTADGRPKDAPIFSSVRGRSVSGSAHVSSDPRLVRPGDAIQQPPGGVTGKLMQSSPRPVPISVSSQQLRSVRTSQTSANSSSGHSPTNSTNHLRIVVQSSASASLIPVSRSQSPPAFDAINQPRSQSPSALPPREPGGPRPRANFTRSTSSPAVSDMRPPAEPRTDTFLFPSSDVADDAAMVQRLQPPNTPVFNLDELSRLLLRLCRALVTSPFDVRAVADCMQDMSAAVYHMSSLLPALMGCVTVTRRNQITAKARDISSACARIEKLLAESPSEPSTLLFEARVLLADVWSLYTTAEITAHDHIRGLLREVAAGARALTAAVLDATKDDIVPPLITRTVTSTLIYLRVASLRSLEQSPQEHLAFMHASLAVARVVKHVCVNSQGVIATRALLGDDAPATATITDLARRLAEVVKSAVQTSASAQHEEAPVPVRFDEALTATAVSGFEDLLMRPSIKTPRAGAVRRSIGPLQTALLSSGQPILDACTSLLTLFPIAPPHSLCDAIGAFGEELSAHAVLLLRSAAASPRDEAQLYVSASQAVLHFALQLKMAAAARALAYPVMPVSVTVVCSLRSLPASLGLAGDVILHS